MSVCLKMILSPGRYFVHWIVLSWSAVVKEHQNPLAVFFSHRVVVVG